MKIQSYRDLIVWEKAMTVAKNLYLATEKMPEEERFGLTSQMRRAAVSIPSNIAEGTKRSTRKDYAKFLRIAFGSTAELETQILLAQELNFITQESADSLHFSLNEISRILQSMILTLRFSS